MKQPLYLLITMLLLFACKKKEDAAIQQPIQNTDTPKIGVPVSDTNSLVRYRFIGETDYFRLNMTNFPFDTVAYIKPDTVYGLIKYGDSVFFSFFSNLKDFPEKNVYIDSFAWRSDSTYIPKRIQGKYIFFADSLIRIQAHGSPGGHTKIVFRGKNDL